MFLLVPSEALPLTVSVSEHVKSIRQIIWKDSGTLCFIVPQWIPKDKLLRVCFIALTKIDLDKSINCGGKKEELWCPDESSRPAPGRGGGELQYKHNRDNKGVWVINDPGAASLWAGTVHTPVTDSSQMYWKCHTQIHTSSEQDQKTGEPSNDNTPVDLLLTLLNYCYFVFIYTDLEPL